MKKFLIIAGCVTTVTALVSCKDHSKPGRAYMPDMAYSVAYETYAPTAERLAPSGASYNARPVEGTIARGEMAPYKFKNDSIGGALAAADVNPLPALDAAKSLEAARLYLINCAICHGAKLDGNGPLYKGGDGPFAAKPATLVGDAKYTAMTEGTMFHSITYGKNAMGSYASQLSTEQRWMIIHYIKDKQGAAAGGAAKTAVADTTAKPVVDTAMKVKQG
jgi:mono/diheme cytochrome c family protein